MSSNSNNTPPPSTLSGLVATLVPVLIVASVYFTIFLVLRRSQRRYYAPRTYLGSLRESERTPVLPGGLFNWFGAYWKLPDLHALQHQSLDAYLFLRFLRMTIVICFVGCCITWPILFPVNATGGGGASQLDILSYSNVNKAGNGQYRYFAHALVTWVYFGFVMYLITRECIFYINLRQAFLLSPIYSTRVSTRTVLFVSVPGPFLDEAKLRKVFGDTVRNIWITGNTKDLDEMVKNRNKAAFTLEKAEVKLIKLANKERQKALKAGGSDEHAEAPADAESGSIAARWVPNKKRPTHRTGFFGLVGPKVDSINWSRTELEKLIPETDAAQSKYRSGTYQKAGSVFIEFRTQAEAECAAQTLTHHHALHMSPRFIGITPSDVVWSSLSLSWWQRLLRRYAVIAFITALIVFWAIPVAVVGSISNIPHLETISWLAWLKKIPNVIMGVVTGLLPSVALSILMSLVPVVMRLCARLAGEPSNSRVELFTQNAYFVFQVVQVFLVMTVSSAATAVGQQIASNPSSATTILSQNLPTASNFYISYFIVQGLSISAGVISQVVGFIIFNLMYKYLAGTPRALYTKWANLSAISWGSTLPVYTNIAVIAITYSGIAPLMLGFATIGMSLFYLAYRYNVLFVTDTTIDTRGLIYPRALKQLLTGIYLSEVCMIGLFGASAAPGPLVLMVAALVFTVLFHMSLNSALDPLLYNLPQTLLAEEENRLLDAEAAAGTEAAAHNGDHNGESKKIDTSEAAAPVAPKKANMVSRFLKPWVYDDYAAMRALVPHNFIDPHKLYPGETEQDAYFPPSVLAPVPALWIPQDAAGVSKQEIAHTTKVISMTDEGCELDEKGNLVWDRETTRPPIWEEKILY